MSRLQTILIFVFLIRFSFSQKTKDGIIDPFLGFDDPNNRSDLWNSSLSLRGQEKEGKAQWNLGKTHEKGSKAQPRSGRETDQKSSDEKTTEEQEQQNKTL